MIRAITSLIASILTLSCAAQPDLGASQSYDPCTEIEELKAIAAAGLGLVPPVEFVQMEISSCSEGTFVDSVGESRQFCVNDGCSTGLSGWSVGPCQSALHYFGRPREPANPAEEESVRVLLAVWLSRYNAGGEPSRLLGHQHSNPEGNETDYLAFLVFNQTIASENCIITEALLCSESGNEL